MFEEVKPHNLPYNTQKEQLVIPEYGRNIQQMVDSLKQIKDKDERTKVAAEVVRVMSDVQRQEKSTEEQLQKLYDQLFIMANFQLDIDSPFPLPEKELLNSKPNIIPYPRPVSSYKFYGHNIPKLIEEAKKLEAEQKQALSIAIATQMKRNAINFNKERIDDETVFNHLYELSGGAVDLRHSKLQLDVSFNKELQPTPVVGKTGNSIKLKKIVKRK